MRSRKHIYRKLLCFPHSILFILFYCYTTMTYGASVERVDSNFKAVKQSLLPLPVAPKLTKSKVLLGRKLFNDPLLSGSQTLACSSCHVIHQGGDDNQQFSMTDKGLPRTVNTPSILNVTHNFTFTWSGAYQSLETLLSDIIISPKTMNAQWPEIIDRLTNQQGYPEEFSKNYPDGITQSNVIDALLTFQKTLVTSNSRFDEYLNGNESAITVKEKQGYKLFHSYGCNACHQGKNVGGNMHQKFGLFNNYYEDIGKVPTLTDFGRFNATGKERDKFYFRVPSLRNVADTAPYLHDGSIQSLDEVISVMGIYQLGREIPEPDRHAIEIFLRTLSGRYDNQDVSEE